MKLTGTKRRAVFIAILLLLSQVTLVMSAMDDNTAKMLKVSQEFASRKPGDAAARKQLRKLSDSQADDAAVYTAVRSYVRSMMVQERHADVFYICWRLVRYDQPGNDDVDCVRFMLDMYVFLGASAAEIGMSNISMEYYAYGLALAETHHEEQRQARFLNNIGACYFNLGDYKSAREYFQKAMAINKRYNLNYDIFLNYNNLSEIGYETDNLDEALNNALLAMQYLERSGNEDTLVNKEYQYIYTQIARLYMKKKDYVLAKTYMENGLKNRRQDSSKADVFESDMLFSDLYVQTNQLDSAKMWAISAYKGIEGRGNLLREIRAHDQLAKICEQQGDYEGSLSYLRSAFHLRDSLQIQENKNRMEQLKQIYDMDRESLIYRSNNSDQMDIRMLDIILGILFLVVSMFSVRWLWDKRRLKQLLAAKAEHEEHEREQQRQKLVEINNKAKEMQESLNLTHRQLTTFTMQKLRSTENQSEIIDDMRKLLATINPRSKELRNDVQTILSKLTRSRASDDWTEFRYYFEKVNPTFYSRLLSAHPDITEKEKRLCALLALGLNTKEIAQITFREVRSVESSRMRLRKKLGLSTEEDLNTYCQSFTDGTEKHEK